MHGVLFIILIINLFSSLSASQKTLQIPPLLPEFMLTQQEFETYALRIKTALKNNDQNEIRTLKALFSLYKQKALLQNTSQIKGPEKLFEYWLFTLECKNKPVLLKNISHSLDENFFNEQQDIARHITKLQTYIGEAKTIHKNLAIYQEAIDLLSLKLHNLQEIINNDLAQLQQKYSSGSNILAELQKLHPEHNFLYKDTPHQTAISLPLYTSQELYDLNEIKNYQAELLSFQKKIDEATEQKNILEKKLLQIQQNFRSTLYYTQTHDHFESHKQILNEVEKEAENLLLIQTIDVEIIEESAEEYSEENYLQENKNKTCCIS